MARLVAYLLLIGWSFGAAAVARSEGRTAWVDGPRIRLSEVVSPVAIDGDLGPAPPPGLRRLLPRERIRAALGADERLDLPDAIVVQTREQRLSCEQFERLLAEALTPTLRPGLTLRSAACRGPLVLPAGALRLSAQFAEIGQQAGSRSARVELRVGEWPAQYMVTPVVVDGSLAVVVAQQALLAGPPALGLLNIEHRAASTVPADAVNAIEELQARQLRWSVPVGSVIRRSMLQVIPAVTRGKTVTVATHLPLLRITTQAIVREDGAVGDWVLVQCLPSNKLVKARVLDGRRVEVDL